jgi:hypothetical protein
MDPITVAVVTVLGKYALDKGAKLAIEIGPQALETVKEMFGMVLARVREEPRGEVIAEEFEADPETYEKPLARKVEAATAADAAFARDLRSLYETFAAQAQAHAAQTGTTYSAHLVGDGAIAEGDNAMAGGKGATVIRGHGNVVGDGSSSRVHINTEEHE